MSKVPLFSFRSPSLPLSLFIAKIIGIMVPWKRDGYFHDLIELKCQLMSEKIDSGGMARERIPHPCNTD
jgi:hypothetical protein